MTEMIDVGRLQEPSWYAGYTLLPDLRVLAASLENFGQLAPVVVHEETNEIIDGVQRCRLVSENKHLREKFNGQVEVRWVSGITTPDAMILHVQMNRGRGAINARQLSRIVRSLKSACGLSADDFKRLFAMNFDELELMLDGTLLKHRKVNAHSYSRAWVPVEAPAGTVEKASISIEKPPNADR